MRCLPSIILVVTLSASTLGQKCPIDFSKYTPEQLVNNPPQNWNFNCITREVIDTVLSNENHVANILNCIKDVNHCKGRGYQIIADEIYNRVSSGGDCVGCSPQLISHVQYTIRKLQKLYPKYLRDGLAYLA